VGGGERVLPGKPIRETTIAIARYQSERASLTDEERTRHGIDVRVSAIPKRVKGFHFSFKEENPDALMSPKVGFPT